MDCQICSIHEAEWRDYRFIESCGLQGKVYSCDWCRELDDHAIQEIMGNDLDPKDFYDEDEESS